jgi:hypothetical protein
MNDKFDELAKDLAQSVTRRQALQRFSLGLAGFVMASIGLENTAKAGHVCDCSVYGWGCPPKNKACIRRCNINCS